MAGKKRFLFLLGLCSLVEVARTVCEEGGRPIACTPPHEGNILLGLDPVVSDTCGLRGPERFCYKTDDGRTRCEYCDASVEGQGHPPSFMTDAHDLEEKNITFWLTFRSSAVVTFPLSKKFQISRVAVSFFSSQPESYSIYKSTDYGETFAPFQYFSLSCEATYGVAESSDVAVGEEDVALCSSDWAGGTSGGETIFRPLDNRPSDLADSVQLQEWVLATHIQLRLDRPATAAEFYAVSEVQVSGTCFCNGHAGSCSGSVVGGDVMCECEHGTGEGDCGQCLSLYHDVPWAPATADDPASCIACNCSNHSDVCRFDVDVYVASGNVSGGVCEMCRDNTEGEQCQRCTLGYYPNSNLPLTSPDHCTLCDCDPRGTVGGEESCRLPPSSSPSPSQRCQCKTNVDQGKDERCSQCKIGYHQLALSNPDGCRVCSECYDRVYLEFNSTQSLLSSLLSHLNSTSPDGQLPADLLQEIRDYRLILEDMLSRARLLTNQERNLTSRLSSVVMETDDLDNLIGRLEQNVSLSEEGLARVVAEADRAAELLRQLAQSLNAVETAIRVDLLTSLSRATQSLEDIESLFNQLVNLSLVANTSSVDHQNLALDLIDSVNESLTVAREAGDLLSLAFSAQNTTSAIIEGLQEKQLRLESVFTNTSSDIREARLTIELAVNQSVALLERLGNISISDYDTSELETRLEPLRRLTQDLVSDTGVVAGELGEVRREVEEVRERAAGLLAESGKLNLLSVELLARTHAALSFANQTVEEGREFVGSVEETLAELELRLDNSTGIVSGLEEVVGNIQEAEVLVSEGEEEGERRETELEEAVREAEAAVLAFEEASRLTAQALEAALRVKEEATATLFNATLLASQTEELAENVTKEEERGAELEAVSMETQELITMATEAAQTASSGSSRLQEEIQQLLGVLEELQVDLNSTELLPSNRLLEVGSVVTELEVQADSNQVTLDALESQVGQLEESSGELRERHTSLQQHRDLLQSILENIQRLDCRNQFQSI